MKFRSVRPSVKIGLWSADYKQITGQALVTARVVQHQARIVWREYVYNPGLRSLGSWVVAATRLWVAVIRGQVRTIYLVCSRSDGGFLRDTPALLTALAGVRVIVHSHGSDIVDLLTARPLSWLARALYNRCEIIVPSGHLLQPLRKLTKMPLHLCENYFVSAAPHENYESLAKADSVMLSVFWNSNIMSSKGFFLLAEAVNRMAENGHAVRLISIGKPIGDADLSEEKAAARLATLRSVSWFDYRGSVNPDIANALTACADVIALPSRYRSECQPLAIIQAMCAGKAIVVSDIPALRETLGDYPASFVPVGSVTAISEALRHLLNEKQSDPDAFVSSRQAPAAAAKRRFAVTRFDYEMASILEGAI